MDPRTPNSRCAFCMRKWKGELTKEDVKNARLMGTRHSRSELWLTEGSQKLEPLPRTSTEGCSVDQALFTVALCVATEESSVDRAALCLATEGALVDGRSTEELSILQPKELRSMVGQPKPLGPKL